MCHRSRRQSLEDFYKHEWVKPLMLTAAKSSLTMLMKSVCKSIIRKIFDGEMLIRTLPTTHTSIRFTEVFTCTYMIENKLRLLI